LKLANSTYLHSIKDANNIGFKATDYSKFKYGDISIANKFGDELFKYFIEKKGGIFELHKKINIYSSPFDFLATSSYYLTKRFFDNLIYYIKINNLNISVEFSKIERQQTYTQDYGAMNADERFNLIKNDTYELKKKPTKNSLLIFIDDVSITGTHQKVIELLLNKNQIKNKAEYLYFAKLTNNSIPPTFENIINNSFVNNENKLLRIMNSDDFRITTRTVKYLLGLETSKLSGYNKIKMDF
jgi:hypothetical protein